MVIRKLKIREISQTVFTLATAFAFAFFVSGCSNMTYTVGGVLLKPTTEGLVLQINNGELLAVGTSPNFKFNTVFYERDAYNVTIVGQPVGEICTFLPGTSSGVVGTANVTSVKIECVPRVGPTFAVGGRIFGLAAEGLLLTNNGVDDLDVASTQLSFSFPGLPVGANYQVAIAKQPSGQSCTVSNETGKIVGKNIDNVSVVCVNQYTVGGSVEGLNALCDDTLADPCYPLKIRNSDGNEVTITKGETNFVFPAIADGTSFALSIADQPQGESCTFKTGTNVGTIAGANYDSVEVLCVATIGPLATIGGRVEGLGEGKSVELTNAGITLTINQTTPPDAQLPFTFSPGLPSGAFYDVEVKNQPEDQTCTVDGGSGEVGGQNISDILVNCVNKFKVSGTIAGLGQDGLLIRSSKGEIISRPGGSSDFAFTQGFEDDSTIELSILAQPDGQRCVFDGNDDLTTISRNINGADITDVAIVCVNELGPLQLLSLTVNGLPPNGRLVLRNLEFYTLEVEGPANGTIVQFAEQWPLGADYRVSVGSVVPGSLNCTVENATGNIQQGLSPVVVNCE